MADQPTEVAVTSQTAPANTVGGAMGAASVYDQPGDVSKMAFDNALGQFTTNVDSGPQEISGVQRTITQGYAAPITWHTAGVSYEIPMGSF